MLQSCVVSNKGGKSTKTNRCENNGKLSGSNEIKVVGAYRTHGKLTGSTEASGCHVGKFGGKSKANGFDVSKAGARSISEGGWGWAEWRRVCWCSVWQG